MSSETNISYDHQCRLISEFLKDSFPSLIAFGSIGITYFATAQRIQDYLNDKSGFVERVSLLKTIIEDSTCFNVWFFFCLCSLFFYFGNSIINKKSPNFSLKILLLVIVSLLFLWYKNEWVYAKFFFIDYRWLTTIGIIALSILSLHSLFRWVHYIFKEYKVKDNTLKPFSNDLPLSREEINEPCNLAKFIHSIASLFSKYINRKDNQEKKNTNIFEKNTSITRKNIAKDIVNRLYITPVQQESYAICISGAWGSGKTSFLNYLKEEIIKSNKDIGLENNIIEFHPWRSSSSSLIIDDFFNLLKKYLKGKIPGVEDDLITYINLLLKFDEPTVKVATPFLDHLFKHNQKEIDDSKRVIAEQLSYLNHKIYIFIDDIDRLESNEMLSVLRLIRNSANFPNLVFIAALDKQYVCDNLDTVKFKDGKSFLEKIFQVEFALPRFEYFDIIDLFRSEIRANLALPNPVIESILRHINNTEEKRYLLTRVITNYRIAKRLVRQFSVTANYMKNTFDKNEFDYEDLFYLEMLHYIDPILYEQLSIQPDSFFKEDFSFYSGNYWYFDNTDKVNYQYSSIYSIDVLYHLFFKYRPLKKGRLALKANYFNYFCLSHPRETVKISDFNLMISYGKNNDFQLVKERVKMWCRSLEKSIESMDSIYNGFICSFNYGKKYTYSEMRPYLAFVFYWFVYEQNNNLCIVDVLRSVLNGNAYANESDKLEANNYFMDHMRYYIQMKDIDTLHIVWVLSNYYRFINNKSIVDKNFIKDFISNICFDIIMSQPNANSDAILLLQKGTPLNLFARYAMSEDKAKGEKLSLVIDKIIEYFANKEDKSKYLFRTYRYYPNVAIGKPCTKYDNEINELANIFGSISTKEYYEKYLNLCFERTEDVSREISQLEK